MAVAVLGVGGMVTGAFADELAEFAAPLKVEYERPPGVDFSQYDRLIINDLDVNDTKIVPPPWTEGQTFKWDISERNVGALQQEFLESMEDQISGNGGYPIVTEHEEGSLELTVRIISFMPYAERKEKVITKGSGEMRISAVLRDGQTGQLLAIYEGPQEVGSEYNENTDFTRGKNLKKLFDSWGRRVRLALDEDHGKS
jgi:membrane peptidoglycan carboxypeptidase